MKEIREIKKNRELLLFENYFYSLERDLSYHTSKVTKYITSDKTVIYVSHGLKVIGYFPDLFLDIIKNCEYLYDYIKKYTTFVDYQIIEW